MRVELEASSQAFRVIQSSFRPLGKKQAGFKMTC